MFEDLREFVTHVLLGGLLAAFTGAIGYFHRQITGRHKISLLEGFIRALGSGVVGMVVVMLCVATELSLPWTGVLVANAGWLGADLTMSMVEKIIHRKIGL